MGPTGPRWAPCWPHKLCYLGCYGRTCGPMTITVYSALLSWPSLFLPHDDVIKWKHFPRYLPFVRGIHRSPLHSPHKGQGRGALMFSLICAWINRWVNNREAGDLRRHPIHCDAIVMIVRGMSLLVSIFYKKIGKGNRWPTHFGLLTLYGAVVLGLHWFR